MPHPAGDVRFSANCGEVDDTMLQYVGLQGDHTHDRREAVHAEYELMCQHADLPATRAEQGNTAT